MKADNKEEALQLLQDGVSCAEIARKFCLPSATVRTWKTRLRKQKEKQRIEALQELANCSGVAGKTVSSETQRKVNYETVSKMVETADENTELSEQQKRFCILYAQRPNATRAYKFAFDGWSYSSVRVIASKLLAKANIRKEITKQKQIVMQQLMADPTDVFQMYWDIAFADMSEFAQWGPAEVPVINNLGIVYVKDENGERKPLTKEVNEVKFCNSSEVDSTLVTEIKQGRDGASVKLASKEKALQWLSDYFEMNPKDQKQIEFNARRLAIEETKVGALQQEEGNIVFQIVPAGTVTKPEKEEELINSDDE